jgi:hypothetical protein
MRSKEVFAYSRSTGYFCSVAASTVRVGGSSKRPDPRGDSNRRVGTCHDGQTAGHVPTAGRPVMTETILAKEASSDR